ncbi:type IV secretion system protein [Enterobacter asburiae]|uniref:type IV secretion system protein n=1 Tax=Enterobacter asburiae TaxID=61645 RepID=UPI0020040A48|nr:type IV secretion system protein [Enterobacter asburiae]MCK7247670.1 type IV secretion system protein [Enterobacter asburiae]
MSGIYVGLNSHIMEGFDSVLNGVTATTGGWMAHLFSVAVLSLYITWRAYQTMAGKLARPFEEIVWDVSRMLIIMIFVTNAGGYLDLVSSAITGIRDGFSGDSSIWALLDTVWEKAQKLGENLFSQDDSRYVPAKGLLAEGLVWAGVASLTGITAFINLIAELVMMLMLATAPIFIYCLMWSWFREMFSNWLKNILTCILTTFFSGISLTVVMNYLDYILAGATGATDANYLTLAVQVFLGAVGAAVVIILSYKLAASLAGASAQGAAQALANAGVSMGASTASNAAGNIGNRAAENLNSTGSATASTASRTYGDARSRSRAAVQRMQERYQR